MPSAIRLVKRRPGEQGQVTQKYLDKKAKSREARELQPLPPKRKISDIPDLELDFSPLAAYARSMVEQSLKERELPDFIREVVREEIASRLRPLFGQA